MMAFGVRSLLCQLATVEPLAVPAGEAGVALCGEPGGARRYVPVLSVYLDLRPETPGTHPGARPARTVLRERLREIEQTFFPRGVALDAVRADAARIEHFLDTQVSPRAKGVAIFASARHHVFETLETAIPFENQVSARAAPDLFQLARLLDDQQTAIVAVVNMHTARLFVSAQGLLREVRGLVDDPKYYHMIRGTNAMNQAHFQRHADTRRIEFMDETAQRIQELADREHAVTVMLAGATPSVARLRAALPPRVARLVHEVPLRLDIDAHTSTIQQEIEPILSEVEADQDRGAIERVVSAIQSGGLGIAGLERARAALERGQVDTLLLASDVALPDEARSTLIELATTTGAAIEIADRSPVLRAFGGVAALLRYRDEGPLSDGEPLSAAEGAAEAHPSA
jgi:hypothetical protein